MKRILITGATGNVGAAVLESLAARPAAGLVLAGVRDVAKARAQLAAYPAATPVRFDFADTGSYQAALNGVETVFLLLPPGLANAQTYFRRFVAAAREAGVRHLVFLSVQGAEKSRFIPHHKIEKLLQASGVAYTLLRPAYFMQNFSTTLRQDIVRHNRIFLPAGRARFTLVDVRDIGRVAAEVLHHPQQHANQAYALTADVAMSFSEMAATLTKGLERPIRYVSPNLLRFFITKKREGLPALFVLVMSMLHYLPRFQPEPPTTKWIERLTGQAPVSFQQYVQDYKEQLS